MSLIEITQTLGPMLMQTTLVLALAALLALPLLRLLGSRRPWAHQFLWGGVLLLGFLGMRIPHVVPIEIPVENSAEAPGTIEKTNVSTRNAPTPDGMNSAAKIPLEEQSALPARTPTPESLDDVFVQRSNPPFEPAGKTLFTETQRLPSAASASTQSHFRTPSTTSSFLTFAVPALFFGWFAVLTIALSCNFARYLRLLALLKNAESPDAETRGLWDAILRDHGVATEDRPSVKILPDVGPSMVRTPAGYTLVLSKPHWNELDTELRQGVMRHELAHVLYGDIWKMLFARLVVLVHWFNPLAHLAARRFEEAVEWSADSFSYGNSENGLEQFAAAMLALHETTPRNYRYTVAFGAKNILRRLEFLERLKSDPKESSWKTGLVLGLSLTLFLLGTLNIRIVAQEKPVEPTSSAPAKTSVVSEPASQPQSPQKDNVTETTPAPMVLTVLDSGGKPIPRATGHASRVDKDGKRPGGNFTTDEQGRVRIERTTPGNASWACFNIKTAGYTPFFAAWGDNKTEYPPTEFTATLDKAKTIGGVVLDPDGKPVQGVDVEFSFPYGERSFNDNGTGCAAKGTTDAEGRWTCGYVPLDILGGMRFSLHHPDFQSTQIQADLDDLKAGGDGKFSHVFTIERGYEIHGTVRDEAGKPIPEARVEVLFFGITGSEKDWYHRTATDAEGRYRFATCPLTDNAAVVAQAPGFAGRYVETSIGSEAKTAVDLVLAPSMPLKLRIVDEEDKPVEKPVISVSRWGPFDGPAFATPVNKMLRADNYEPLKLDDGQGNWTWNDAIAGKFQVSVWAEGFMSQQYVDVEADRNIRTIIMKPCLQVTGTVVDDETGDPIPAFRYVEGLGNTGRDHVSWQTHRKQDGKDGSFQYFSSSPQRHERRLRVEADGYENCDSRLIENDEGSVALTFRMKRAMKVDPENAVTQPERSGLVLTPDGKPAADARVLVSSGRIYVTLDHMDHHVQTKTDRDGKFTLPAIPAEDRSGRTTEPEKPCALVLIHEEGCLYLVGEDFERKFKTTVKPADNTATDDGTGPIRLEPWGELEGTLMIGSRPGEGSQISVRLFADRTSGSPRFDFNAGVTTGKDGQFSVRKLFPGEYTVARSIVLQRKGSMTRTAYAITETVVVESGKTAKITLGGTGRPVVGRIAPSPEAETILNDGNNGVRIYVPRPKYPDPPELPEAERKKFEALLEEIAVEHEKLKEENDEEKLRAFEEKLRAMREEWLQTEVGKKYHADVEAYQREAQAMDNKYRESSHKVFGGVIKDDGSFRVEDVASGDRVLEILAFDENHQTQIQVEHPFTVPEMPEDRSDEPFDVGTIPVEVRSTALAEPK